MQKIQLILRHIDLTKKWNYHLFYLCENIIYKNNDEWEHQKVFQPIVILHFKFNNNSKHNFIKIFDSIDILMINICDGK